MSKKMNENGKKVKSPFEFLFHTFLLSLTLHVTEKNIMYMYQIDPVAFRFYFGNVNGVMS